MKKTEIIKLTIASIIVVVVAWMGFCSSLQISQLGIVYPEPITLQEAAYVAFIKWIRFLFAAVPLVAGWLLLKGFFKE